MATQPNTLAEIVEHLILIEGELVAARSLYREIIKPTSKVNVEMTRYVAEELEAYADGLVRQKDKLFLAINNRYGPDHLR